MKLRIATSFSTISFRALGVLFLLFTVTVFAFIRDVRSAAVLLGGLLVSTLWLLLTPKYLVTHSKSTAERYTHSALSLLSLPDAVSRGIITIDKLSMEIHFSPFGGWTIMTFRFPRPPSTKQAFVKKTLIHYQRPSLNQKL